MRSLFALFSGVTALHAQGAFAGDSITLTEALARVRQHPALEARALEADARVAEARQVGRLDNPRLSVEAENVGGSGPYAGGDMLEVTARLGQSLPLGGRLAADRRAGEAEARLAREEAAMVLLELRRAVREAFFDALGAQAREALAARKVGALADAVRGAERRRAAGAGQVAEVTRLGVELALAEQERNRAAFDAAAARGRLRVLTGDSALAWVSGDLDTLPPLPDWETTRASALRHPDFARLVAAREVRRAMLEAARAQRVPDLDFSAGLRRTGAPGGSDVAVVAGVSLPLPLWNRNAGGVSGASSRLAASDREEEAARRAREAEVRALWEDLRLRRSEIARLRAQVLPDAARAADASRTAWLAGRQSVLELLDGQRLFFDVNSRYLEALSAWHRERAALDALAGLSNLNAER